jgi:hypothetical protein
MLHSGESASDLLLTYHGSYTVLCGNMEGRTLRSHETNIMNVRKCCILFLGAFKKLQKRLLALQYLSVCIGQLRFHRTDFYEIGYWSIF